MGRSEHQHSTCADSITFLKMSINKLDKLDELIKLSTAISASPDMP